MMKRATFVLEVDLSAVVLGECKKTAHDSIIALPCGPQQCCDESTLIQNHQCHTRHVTERVHMAALYLKNCDSFLLSAITMCK